MTETEAGDRDTRFLSLVRTARWRDVPPAWRECLRSALSSGWVRVGWGGVLELTAQGELRLRAAL